MNPLLIGGIILLAALGSLLFSTLTYSLRDFSRARLSDWLETHGKAIHLDRIVDRQEDLIFLTACGRLLANIFVLLGFLRLLYSPGTDLWLQYLGATGLTLLITLFVSVAIPHAAARYAAESIIGTFTPTLRLLHAVFVPVTTFRRAIDAVFQRVAGARPRSEPQQIEQDILSVVEEGEKEGIVDEHEREMIESVIEFRDTQVAQIMTPRPQIVALEVSSTLAQVKATLEESGHSRVPVYEGSIDHIVGILYARDLLRHLGQPADRFDIRTAIRPAIYIPETKPLQDLLQDFRNQKVHIAIVLDEYGGAAGLVTIEDILEELVGDISDEYELTEPAMLKRIDDTTYEVDARMRLDEANRTLGLAIDEDAGYDTLGGFVATTIGRIPPAGASFEHGVARFTVVDAQPQKINRLKIELLPRTAEPRSKASS